MHRSTDSNRFQTPYSLTQTFLDTGVVPKWVRIQEPACADGAIIRVLHDNGYDAEGSDIDPGEGYPAIDFLKDNRHRDYIVTNPPYGKMADKFVVHAKQVSRFGFAMLLRVNYLSGSDRFNKRIYDWLRYIYVFNRMPDLSYPLREDGKFYTGGIVYAWMVWEQHYTGAPTVHQINVDKYAISPPKKASNEG